MSYHGSDWSPSEWYKYQASPTVKRLTKRHVDGHHTEHCIKYDPHYFGTYCKWLDNVFWPRVYFTKAIDLVEAA